MFDISNHSASETVRGDLLTVSECAAAIKDCRRVRHHMHCSAEGAGPSDMDSLWRTEAVYAAAQRFLASGAKVHKPDRNRFVLKVDDVEFCFGNSPGNTTAFHGEEPCLPPRLTVMPYGKDRSGADGIRPHVWVGCDLAPALSYALVHTAPKLSVAFAGSWAESVRVQPELTGWIRANTQKLGTLEKRPGRLHGELLRLISSHRVGWLTTREFGGDCDGSLLVFMVHALFGCETDIKSDMVRRAAQRLVASGCTDPKAVAAAMEDLRFSGYITD